MLGYLIDIIQTVTTSTNTFTNTQTVHTSTSTCVEPSPFFYLKPENSGTTEDGQFAQIGGLNGAYAIDSFSSGVYGAYPFAVDNNGYLISGNQEGQTGSDIYAYTAQGQTTSPLYFTTSTSFGSNFPVLCSLNGYSETFGGGTLDCTVCDQDGFSIGSDGTVYCPEYVNASFALCPANGYYVLIYPSGQDLQSRETGCVGITLKVVSPNAPNA